MAGSSVPPRGETASLRQSHPTVAACLTVAGPVLLLRNSPPSVRPSWSQSERWKPLDWKARTASTVRTRACQLDRASHSTQATAIAAVRPARLALLSILHPRFASGSTPTDPSVYQRVATTVGYRHCTQPRIVGFVSRGALVKESCEGKVATRSRAKLSPKKRRSWQRDHPCNAVTLAILSIYPACNRQAGWFCAD